jgi:hypothetical protein
MSHDHEPLHLLGPLALAVLCLGCGADAGSDGGNDPDAGTPPADGSDTDATPPDAPTPCLDACGRGSAPICDGAGVRSCTDRDGDGCVEPNVEPCPQRCSGGACVECVDSDDCADPVRQRCDYDTSTCLARDQWSVTQIEYGSSSVVLDDCAYCDCYYADPTAGAVLRFQQGGGYTVWSLTLPASATAGTHPVGRISTGVPHVLLTESDAARGSDRGSYWSTGGSVTLARAEYRSGGVFEGTLRATVAIESPPMSATLSATFFARCR